MFTRADYMDYFQLLAEKERAMVFHLQKLVGEISDEYILGIFQDLLREERLHYEAVGELFAKLFKPAIDKRQHTRDWSLGDVKLRNLDSGETMACRCIDVSPGGMSIELSRDVPQGLLFDVEVRFFDARRPVFRRARSAWTCRTDAGQYKAGLQFEDTKVKTAVLIE
jgi:hypothetical protein